MPDNHLSLARQDSAGEKKPQTIDHVLSKGSKDLAEPASSRASKLARRVSSWRHRSLLHAYEYRGRRVVVDPVFGVTFAIDEQTLRIAQAVSSQMVGEELAAELCRTGIERAETFVADIEFLEGEGHFRRESLRSEIAHENATQAFLNHTPRKMMLIVSQTCNLRCVYCYAIEGNFEDRGQVMTLDRAKDAIKWLDQRSAARRHLTVTLFGGEPLANFGMLKELVPWAEEWTRSVGKTIHFTITTNATLLSDEVIDFLLQHRMSILISLDGPPDVQDENRPNVSGRGSFGMLEARLRRLFERHPNPEDLKVRATMTHQHHDTRKLARFFEEFGFQRIGLGASVGWTFAKGAFDLTNEDLLELFDQTEALIDEGALDAVRAYEWRPYNPLASALGAMEEAQTSRDPAVKIGCGVGRNDQAVDVDGNIYPCHRYVGMSAYVLGDIYSGLDHRKVEAYYRRVFAAHDICQSCWATRWCSGHCAQYLSHPSGRVHTPDSGACDSIRRNVERSLALYDQLKEEGVDMQRVRSELTDD